MKHRIYLASRYGRRDELRQYRDELVAMGHTVTSEWLDTEYDKEGGGSSVAPEEQRRKIAEMDYTNLVDESDMLILFSEDPDNCSGKRGGRHVEFGMALEACHRMMVVGPRENVFHYLPDVEVYATWEEAKRVV